MSILIRVLIIEDSENEVRPILRELEQAGYEPVYQRVDTAEDMVAALDAKPWDVIISDYKTPHLEGLEALGIMRSRGIDVPFIVVASHIDKNAAIKAMKAGVYDYILKNDLARLVPAIQSKQQDIEIHRENKLISGALLFLAQRSWTTTGEEFFSSLVRYLAETLNVDYAYIGKLSENKKSVETVALYAMGEIQPNIKYQLLNSPCENVVGAAPRTYPRDIQKQFPEDELLKTMQAESYVGIPLWDSNGDSIGLIALLHRKPLDNVRLADSLLQLIAVRAGAELEHKESEDSLKESEAGFRLLAENSTDMISRYTPDGVYLYASPASRTLLGYEPEDLIGHNAFEFIHPDDMEAVEDTHKKIITYPQMEIIIHRMRRKDGVYQWIETTSHAIRDPETGQVVELQAASRDITARKESEQALLASEHNYHLLFENMTAGFAVHEMIYDENGLPVDYRYIEANPAFEKLTGISVSNLVGKTVKEIIPGTEQYWIDIFARVAQTGEPTAYQNYSAGLGKYYDTWAFSPAKDKFAVVFTDITERKLEEKHILEINRTLRVLSEVNQALIRGTDETALLQDVCRIAVEVGGYRMAWIGYAEQDKQKTVRPVAQAGFNDGYLDSIRIEWSDTEYGRGPTGTAIRTRKPCSISETSTDSAFAPWHDEATKRGYVSVVSVPMVMEDQVLGAMTFYSATADTFDEEESNLLMELAGDLAYGIASIRTREERDSAEKQAYEYGRQMATILESITDSFMSLTEDLRFTYINSAAEIYSGMQRENILGKNIFEVFPALSDSPLGLAIRKTRTDGVPMTVEALDPSLDRWIEAHVYPAEAGLSIYFRDVTERKMADEHKREFYRRTILAATQGKLIITDNDEIDRVAGTPVESWQLMHEDELGVIRHAIRKMCQSVGMDETSTYDMLLCVGEAGTNAIKHAGGGEVSLHMVSEGLFVVIRDNGRGIDALILPEATIRLGYSTAGSLGMGYKAIISLADQVYLATGPQGTTVAFLIKLHAENVPTTVFDLPDTW